MLDAHLGHRFTVQRNTSSAKDPYNNTATAWTVIATDVHGRLIESRSQQVPSETAQAVVVSSYTLLALADADIAVGDRVTDVIYEDGSAAGLTFRVSDLVTRRAGAVARHLSATLEIVE